MSETFHPYLEEVFERGALTEIPFADDAFAAVICVAVLDHVTFDSARAAMAEIRRVLAPGGTVLLTFDPPDQDEAFLDEAEVLPDGTLKFVRGQQVGMLFRRYKDKEIRELLGERQILSFDYTGEGERVVVCR